MHRHGRGHPDRLCRRPGLSSLARQGCPLLPATTVAVCLLEIECTVELTSNTLQNRVMSETDPNVSAASSAAGAPGEPILLRIRNEAQKPHSHWAGMSTWNTVLATILAIAGTVIAYEQWHLADVTNRASDQQAAATAKAADQE